MSATRTRVRRDRGTALIGVMMFATTVSALCLFTLTSSTATYATARSRLDSTKAFYVAEGGLDFLMGNVSSEKWFPARNATLFPTVNGDGSFESNWVSLGAAGGEFKIVASYQTANAVPATWTGTGFPSDYVPFTNVVLANRASSTPSFNRISAVVIGRYNGVTRRVTTGIRWKQTLYGSAIVSDAAPIAGTGSGKGFAISNDAIVLAQENMYIRGGITSNNNVVVDSTSTPLVEATASAQIGGVFTGGLNDELYGTEGEIPDFTAPGSATQLFDFARYEEAARRGAGMVFNNLTQFAAAMRAANALDQKLQGIIHVRINAASEGGSPAIDDGLTGTGTGPKGINIDGTLVFSFKNTSDRFYKVFIKVPLNINAVPLTGFDPADPTTYETGYPPVLPTEIRPSNVDISTWGFSNFSPDDDLPALMFDNGTVDIHDSANICGVMYSPSFMEIENKSNKLQYFNGSIISGGGIYFQSASTSPQVVNFDPSTVDSLATFDLRGQAPSLTNYAVGQ